jgi:phosphate:Na+ symporter
MPASVVVRYNRSAVLASEGEIWITTNPVSYSSGRVQLTDLKSASSYVYQVGFVYPDEGDSQEIIWSERRRFETKIPWGFTRFVLMVGSLCIFIYGMKTMTTGVQASAGERLRQIIDSMTKNRFAGVLSGFFLTGILQSSSATTVMTVSFVNAGVLSLLQSTGVMMGANIGTTITGWLVSFFGFRVDITVYALILFALATPLLLLQKSGFKSWSTALVGFAMIFLGLGFLMDTVPTFTENSAMVQFFIEYSTIPVLGVLLFIGFGAILTVIIQSSSTAITLTMALCASGVVPFPVAAAMVLGENIGTTATAEIAALVGNVHAKRSARIHSLFNIIGVCWMVFLLPFILPIIGKYLPHDPYEASEMGRQSATIGLAAFHTVFNLANLLLLIWFVPLLVKLAIKTVPSRGEDDEEFRLEFINSSIQISEISLVEVKNELTKFGELTSRMSGFVRTLLLETDSSRRIRTHERIKKYERITDRLEIEISQYCGRLSQTELSTQAAEKVRSFLGASSELERLGDLFYQMSSAIERKSASKIWFAPQQRQRLLEMFDILDEAMVVMIENLEKVSVSEKDVERAKKLEKDLDNTRDQLRKDYIKSIEKGNYNLRSGSVYNDLFSSLEQAGDHVLSVSEALFGNH